MFDFSLIQKKLTSTGVEVSPSVTTGSYALLSLSSIESSKPSFWFEGADLLDSEDSLLLYFILKLRNHPIMPPHFDLHHRTRKTSFALTNFYDFLKISNGS